MLLERAPLLAAAGAALLLMSTAFWLAHDLRGAADDADVAQAQAILGLVRPNDAAADHRPEHPVEHPPRPAQERFGPPHLPPAPHKRPGPNRPPAPHKRPAPKASSILKSARGLGVTYAAISFASQIVDEAGSGRGKSRTPFAFERGDGWVRTISPHPMRPPRDLELHGPPRGVIIFEFEPLASQNLRGHAVRLIAICFLASILLVVLAVVVSRSARQHALLGEQAEQDRRLAVLGEMSAVMAHEIRNPLTALKGHAQLLAEQLEGSEEHASKIARVVTEAERLELLTRNLLDFVKTGTLDRVSVSPVDVVASAASRVPGLEVKVSQQGEPRSLDLDPERLTEALVNILENAGQAAPGQPVTVDVLFESRHVEIRLRDHGPGLAAGSEEKIFDPFNTNKVHGVGLGLAIARRIVEAHQGRLAASNHPEGGAVFSIILEQVTS